MEGILEAGTASSVSALGPQFSMMIVHSSLSSDEQVVNPISPDTSSLLPTAQKSCVCFPISLELSSSGFDPTSTSWGPGILPSLYSGRAVGSGWTAFGSADTFGMAKNEHMCSDMPWIFTRESWFDFFFSHSWETSFPQIQIYNVAANQAMCSCPHCNSSGLFIGLLSAFLLLQILCSPGGKGKPGCPTFTAAQCSLKCN